MSLLVVEDNEINLKVVLHLLQKLGLAADFATAGSTAIEMAARQDYRIILMDCHMPDMDGFETTTTIRTLERTQHRAPAYIVAVTADVMTSCRERCLEAGMDDYLSKPLLLSQLRVTLERALAAQADQPEQTAHHAPASALLSASR